MFEYEFPTPLIDSIIDRMYPLPDKPRDLAVRMYIGFGHKTEGFEDELTLWLKPDILDKRIIIVDDIKNADLYTPLVCAGNIASDDFWGELEVALHMIGRLQILPIWLFPIVGVHPLMKLLSTFGGLPGSAKSWFAGRDREEIWAEILGGIRHAVARLSENFEIWHPMDNTP